MPQFKYIFRNAVTNATLALSRMILNSLIDENCESLSQIIEVTSVFHENKVEFNITLHIISTTFTLQYRGEVIQWSTDFGNIYETLVKVNHKVFIFYIVEFCFLFLKLSDLVFSRLPISYQQKNCFTQSGGSVG